MGNVAKLLEVIRREALRTTTTDVLLAERNVIEAARAYVEKYGDADLYGPLQSAVEALEATEPDAAKDNP